ncbi:hypothetical protein [Nitrosomonas communis]|nr:hypothetical protein [Nitrosomonas communis]MCO6427469.1 hypothetical protein [Nitrosomonas communis]
MKRQACRPLQDQTIETIIRFIAISQWLRITNLLSCIWELTAVTKGEEQK